MPDKDQFTFDDDDGFPETNLGSQKNPPASDLPADENPVETDFSPDEDSVETDLSAAFFDGEHDAGTPVQEDPEPKVPQVGSTMRIALMVLLLVVIGGAGIYYFMGLGGTSPAVSTPQVPAQKAKKSVALPPQQVEAPAQTPVASAQTSVTPVEAKQKVESVTVAVPSPAEPRAKPADKLAGKMALTTQSGVAEKLKPVEQTQTHMVSPAPKPEAAMEKMVIVASASPKAAKQLVGSAYALDAGSYLMESNRKALVTKIKKLGYEPLITPIDVTLDMTRLRLGTYNKDEVQVALASARTIEPGSYSVPVGGQYVIYAGAFLNSRTAEKLTQRLLAEGVKVYPESAQVVRTLSRIRFGSFATRAAAAAAAREVGETGLKAAVVKYK